MRWIISTWRELDKPIYVGRRLKSNLTALMAISLFAAALGFVLFFVDLITAQYAMLIPAAVTFAGGVGCAFVSGVIKKREAAVLFPIVFCVLAFTYFALSGAADGTAILWSLLMPFLLCYFVSVKKGMILSVSYFALLVLLFYTPIRHSFDEVYTSTFMMRFPILYGAVTVFTVIGMVQFHRGLLFENERVKRLRAEMEKQAKATAYRVDRLETVSEEMLRTLAHAIDAKDKYTNGHSFRVSLYAVALADRLGWGEEEVEDLRWEALLHDIGKIGVPDQVLNKPGKLTPEEFSVICSHTTIGGDILAESRKFVSASETARYHHERYDGTGYPAGLAGTHIPRHARVVSIADAYDAMRSDRIYRPGLAPEVIRGELEKGRCTQFDPVFLDAFLKLVDNGELEKYAHSTYNETA